MNLQVGFGRFLLLGALLLLGNRSAAETPPESADDAPFTFSTFRNIAKKELPSVVNVAADVPVEESAEDFPLFRFYRDAPDQPEPRAKGTGSGLILSADGFIVTNFHVIEGVPEGEEVEITLQDGSNLSATIVGKDSQLDIAVLKANPEKELQAGILGDSDKVQIGDWVLAIGSPYGLSHSVSAGIVSALGRDIQTGAYDSFIQTDAAINRGNSGGPLFNIHGEVIGINTAIISSSGGSNGIGFAIPINQVKDIVEDLKSKGSVVRGWLGVDTRDITRDELTELNLQKTNGTLVEEVWDGSPALKAGLAQDDVIVKFDTQTIDNTKALLLAVARAKIGTTITLDILRKGAPMQLQVEIAARPGELDMAAHSLDPTSVVRPKGLGAAFQIVDERLREKYELGEEEGFVVTEVGPKSPAETAGFQVGDLLLEINRKRVEGAEDLIKGLKDSTKTVLFLVRRGPKSLFLSVDVTSLGDSGIKNN